MRTKLFLSLCLAAMPFCLAGCDSGTETAVGTATNEIPPEIAARQKEMDEKYKKMQENQQANPTPVPPGQSPPPPGGG